MAGYFIDSTSRMRIPSGQYMDLGISGWSLAVWAKVLSTGSPDGSHQQFIFHNSGLGLTQPNTPSIRIVESNNILAANFWDSQSPAGVGTNTVINTSPPSTGIDGEWSASGWFHIVFQTSRGHAASRTGNLTRYTSLYINSTLIGVDSQDGLQAATGINLILGRRGNVSSESNLTLTGCLAEFCKFDRCLSDTEIKQLYNGHDPELLSNGPPAVYYPLRNDFIDKITGRTGVQFNVLLTGDHPIPDKFYYPIGERQTTLPQLDGRVGILEQRGLVDRIDWTPGGVPPTGISQTGAFFSQARLGDGYIAAPNRSLSGCTVSCYASGGAAPGNSGYLQMIVTNLSPLPVDLSGQIRFSIYRL